MEINVCKKNSGLKLYPIGSLGPGCAPKLMAAGNSLEADKRTVTTALNNKNLICLKLNIAQNIKNVTH